MSILQNLKTTDTSKALKPLSARGLALDPEVLSDQTRRAAEEILMAGEAENTRLSYQSAVRYWCAWFQARYGRRIPLPVPLPVVVQFLVDHVGRSRGAEVVCELPKAIDSALVAAGAKGGLGPLKINTVVHRLAVLSKLHQLRRLANPCEDAAIRHLLSKAKRASSKRGEVVTQKTAATREPLEAMVATCDDSLEGVRDKAVLLFGWASGGRRRSEVATATVEQLTKVDDRGYLLRLGHSKTNQVGDRKGQAAVDKPIKGVAADALRTWLERSEIKKGPIFRRLWKKRVGPPLSPAAVAQILKRRAALAGLPGDWGGHSLRSGFVTEAGRQKIPLGDVMAMTDHRKVDTLLGYYRSGELAKNPVGDLLSS